VPGTAVRLVLRLRDQAFVAGVDWADVHTSQMILFVEEMLYFLCEFGIRWANG
jgi:hypothetical protein